MGDVEGELDKTGKFHGLGGSSAEHCLMQMR